MDLSERIAMCTNPNGPHEHIELAPGEPVPTTCFADCDCTPVEYVRVATDRGAVSVTADMIERGAFAQIEHLGGWDDGPGEAWECANKQERDDARAKVAAVLRAALEAPDEK